MQIWKKTGMFLLGGTGYVGMELMWRGRSHVSMFVAGGVCFLLLGRLNRCRRLSRPGKALVGAGIVTAVELAAGLMVNRSYTVWDYRQLPLNFLGQICLPYSLLWIPVSALAMGIYRLVDARDSAPSVTDPDGRSGGGKSLPHPFRRRSV